VNNYLPIRFNNIEVSVDVPLWKQILWASIYDWDEYPKGFTLTLLGFNINFFLGKW
jgi:hypothetical protein